jgi:hypothetical protein
VKEFKDGLLMVAAAEPDSPEMTESDSVLLGLERYLGEDAFAGRGYPDIPCRVPKFDLSDTIMQSGVGADAYMPPPIGSEIVEGEQRLIYLGHDEAGGLGVAVDHSGSYKKRS